MSRGNFQFIKQVKSEEFRVSTITVDNVFSDQYKSYLITTSIVSYNATATGVDMRLIDNNGDVISDAEYKHAFMQLRSNASFNEVRTGSGTADNWDRPFTTTDQLPQPQGGTMYLFNPYDASSYTIGVCQSSGNNGSSSLRSVRWVGQHLNAEAIRGYQLLTTDSDMGFGSLTNVYGIK